MKTPSIKTVCKCPLTCSQPFALLMFRHSCGGWIIPDYENKGYSTESGSKQAGRSCVPEDFVEQWHQSHIQLLMSGIYMRKSILVILVCATQK